MQINAGYDSKYLDVLSKYEDQLPELFNVSKVTVMQAAGIPLESFQIHWIPATGSKCDRCWRHVPDVGQEKKYPTVCLRCVEALDAIDFPRYPANS
jgi:isoleucyl-tRNA synthetase